MGKHTPRPWIVDLWQYKKQVPERTEIIVQNNEFWIAKMNHGEQGKENPYTIPEDQAMANAQLMAAAPELLAACKEALELVVGGSGDLHLLGKLKAAIAKAEDNS